MREFSERDPMTQMADRSPIYYNFKGRNTRAGFIFVNVQMMSATCAPIVRDHSFIRKSSTQKLMRKMKCNTEDCTF